MRLSSSGMRAVEAAQAGLDVGQSHAELRRCHRRGHRGIDVADDDNPIGPVGDQHGLEAVS